MRLLLSLLILFIIPIAFAETITTNMNATYINGTNAVQIFVESSSTVIGCSNGSMVSMPVTFNRDITCTSVGCSNQMDNLTKYLTFYWSNYSYVQNQLMECNASKERMIGIEESCSGNLRVYSNSSSEYQQKYENCNVQYNSCITSKSVSDTNYNNCTERNKNNAVFIIGSFLAGLGGMYLIKKNPKGKTPTDGMVRH